MSSVAGIYQIKNIVNGHIYIGSTIDFKKRWKAHKQELRTGSHHSIHLQRAWNMYGENAFEFSVLCEVDDTSSLLDVEQAYLDECAPEYNICSKAGSPLGVKHTDETKRKLSEAHKGKQMSEEARAKLSELNKGKHLSEEHKRKIGEANKGALSPNFGKHPSEEARRKNSDANKGSLNHNFGKHPSEETRLKMSEAHKGNTSCLGNTLTEEHKRKLSEAWKHRASASEETRAKMSAARKGNTNCLGHKLTEEHKHKLSVALLAYCEAKHGLEAVPIEMAGA